MGLFTKKSVPVRFRGRNLQNVTAKLTRRGIEPWEFQMNEQEEDLILNAIQRNLGFQLGRANQIMRRIINNGNAVEYDVLPYNNNNNEEERREQEELNNEYARWAEDHLLNMMNRRGGSKKLRKTSKRRRKHKRHTKKH